MYGSFDCVAVVNTKFPNKEDTFLCCSKILSQSIQSNADRRHNSNISAILLPEYVVRGD